MKLTFLGSGSAFTLGVENYHSNILIETEGENLLFDCGTTIADALHYSGYGPEDIKNVYITHNHADHNGGLEYIGFKRYFSSFPFGENIPTLIASSDIINECWDECLRGGMKYIPKNSGVGELSDFFNVVSLKKGMINKFCIGSLLCEPIPTTHCEGMPSYGLIMSEIGKSEIGPSVLITGDSIITDFMMDMYRHANIIFQDCEVKNYPNSVHAQYHELNELPAEIKAKMYLYHYTTDNGAIELPDAVSDGFRGFVRRGDIYEF